MHSIHFSKAGSVKIDRLLLIAENLILTFSLLMHYVLILLKIILQQRLEIRNYSNRNGDD